MQHYRDVCRSCHNNAHSPSPDCAGCHMPKRRTEDVVHVVMTDHKIQRRPPAQALARRGERHDIEGVSYQGEVTLYYPPDLPSSPERDLYLAAAQVAQKSNVKEGIPRLEAALAKHKPATPDFYFELAQAYLKSDRRNEAIASYQRALERDASFLPALRSLGAVLSQSGQASRAIEILERARASAPADAVTRNELGKAYQQAGRLREAIAEVREAVRLNPDLTEAHYTLGSLTQDEQAYREAIRIQPDFAEAHNDLGNLLTARQDFGQADYHFGAATRLSPKQAAIQYNYGISLAVRGRFDEAERLLERAATLAPAMAEAHASLGDLKARRGDWRGATRHYQSALAARPDFGPALLGMGTALGATGDFAGARSFLGRAAASHVPGIREEAADLLRSLDRESPPRR